MIVSDVSSMSKVRAKVDIYKDDTLVKTCTCSDVLQDFQITRVGDTGKFFGFGIPHKLSVNFIDLFRELTVTAANTIEIGIGDGDIFDYPYPTFYVTEVNRNEKTNTITVTAYDKLYKAATVTLSEVGINPPYTVKRLAESCAAYLGLSYNIEELDDGSFDVEHETGGNFEGTEPLKEVFTAIAEVTQTIYYINSENSLTYRRLDKDGDPVFTIGKDDYYELDTKTNRKLTKICSTTDLGDNLESSISTGGTTQYVRNNPLWELRTDRATLIDIAINSVGGITINQFDCDWAGNYLLEIGDKIALTTEDGNTVDSFLLNDTVEYGGVLTERTEWEYTADDDETAGNPTNLGEKLNQTFAKVDKLEKNITLYVGEIVDEVIDESLSTVEESVSQLQVTTNGISASVSSIETTTQTSLEALEQSVHKLTNEVNLKLSEEDVTITISETLSEGVDKIVTSTKKYTLDDTGLNIGSSDSPISTVVNEDGMRIHRSGEEVLTADNTGVKAEDLHATTYLIIGENSRFEDWQDSYTACFWIGG